METLEEVDLCFPQLNSSCSRPKRPRAEVILSYITVSSMSLLTVTFNLLVIISILHFKQLHTPTNLLLLSLAVSDFFVGLLVFFQIALVDGCWFLGDITCTLYQYLAYIITSASIGNMVLICVDRYVAVCVPLQYATTVTLKRSQVCVCLCWTCSVLFQSLVLKENLKQPGRFISCSGECVVITDYIMDYVDLVLTFIGPVGVIVVLYGRVFVVAVSQARAMRSHVAAVQRSVRVTVQKSELKAAKTLGVIVLVFLVCLCPYFLVVLTASDALLSPSSAAFVICLFYFNSCVNPLIYAFFYPWFRKCLKYIFTLEILQSGSHEANLL